MKEETHGSDVLMVLLIIVGIVGIIVASFLIGNPTPEQILAREQAQVMAQQQRETELENMHRRELERLEATPVGVMNREIVDDNSMSVGEYVGTRLIMNVLGF